jgi:hypothetical protein
VFIFLCHLLWRVQLIFTDDSPEEWCASSPKRAFSNIFPIPVSQLNDNTQRVYAFMTRQDVTELVTDENGMDTKRENLVQVGPPRTPLRYICSCVYIERLACSTR